MVRRPTRRGLLRGVAGALATGAAWGPAAASGGGAQGQAAFDPRTHGFGFGNWSTRERWFDPPAVDEPDRGTVRERIADRWEPGARETLALDLTAVPAALLDVFATQAWTALAQRSGTNGHCYGMVLTAQQYHERPDAIPLDRSRAAEFVSPVEPVEDPGAAPVYERIVELQARQFLQFRAWLGRRAMLYPDRIDQAAVLADVRSALERNGTAAVTIFDDALNGHQVLAYDVVERSDGVDLRVYDPNVAARRYEATDRRLRFDRTGDGVEMRPYGQYTRVLYNRFDRISEATGRTATPLDHLTVDRETVLASLFPAVVVAVDTPGVDLAVAGPEGGRLQRLRAPLMDVTRGAVGRVRSAFGGRTGDYRIVVTGERDAEYDLELIAADPDGAVLDVTRSDEIGAGETHRYLASLPSEGRGSIERVEHERPSWHLAAAGLAGAVAGSAVYGAVRERRE